MVQLFVLAKEDLTKVELVYHKYFTSIQAAMNFLKRAEGIEPPWGFNPKYHRWEATLGQAAYYLAELEVIE